MWIDLILILLICTPSVWCTIVENLVDDIVYPDNTKPDFVTKCFGDLGCFYTGPPFYNPKLRPVTVPPDSNTVTKFYLFTPDNPNKSYEIEATERSLNNSKFNGNLPIKVLIHGIFTNSLSDFYDMKEELLKHDKYNVIVVDWTQNNGFPLWQAIANARLNAAKVAKLLKFLMKKTSLKSSNIHLIAHSLGAQMAGWIGTRIRKIGRISGLDPAGPYFQKSPRSVRLDSTDADFIDIIHTNSGNNATEGFGLLEPIGNINFYPNGGNHQPGCSYPEIVKNAVSTKKIANACAHSRAIQLYTASIDNSNCQFLATKCSSWDKFKQGDCRPRNSKIREMGFHCKKSPRVPRTSKFYLRTGDEYPFCKQNGYIP